MEKEFIRKFIRGEASFEQRRRVSEWASSAPENLKELEDERQLYFMLLLHSDKADRSQPISSFARVMRRAGSYALHIAAVLIIGLAIGYSFYSLKLGKLSHTMVAAHTQGGQRLNMTLADGTKVWLNAQSQIDYPILFAKAERRVKVTGEAMFDVEADASRPFIVETFAYDIEVLGTKFNIIADEVTGAFSAALLRGEIKILGHNAGEQITMAPNDVVTLVDGRLKLSKIGDEDAYIWPEGYISLKGHSFTKLIAELEKVFNTQITVEGHIEGVNRKYQWGKIRVADGIDDALEILQASYPFAYKRNADDNTVVITGK